MQQQESPIARLSRDLKRYSFSLAHPPVLEIDAGQTIVVETHDARSGTIQSSTDLLDVPHPEGLNPVTGPVYVRGAEPGDSLLVRIRSIQLANCGFSAVKAGVGLLARQAERFETRIIPIHEGWCQFSSQIQFPVRPMIGTIGVAPLKEISTLYVGPHGGNMDNNYVCAGSVVHLPVQAPGGRLSLGDVHARMGDGEVSMIGLDIAAEVTMTIDIARGEGAERPWIETASGEWVTTGDDLDPTVALRIACDQMVSLIMKRLDLSFENAYMLASMYADLGICQACDPGRFPVTTRMVFRNREMRAGPPQAARQP